MYEIAVLQVLELVLKHPFIFSAVEVVKTQEKSKP